MTDTRCLAIRKTGEALKRSLQFVKAVFDEPSESYNGLSPDFRKHFNEATHDKRHFKKGPRILHPIKPLNERAWNLVTDEDQQKLIRLSAEAKGIPTNSTIARLKALEIQSAVSDVLTEEALHVKGDFFGDLVRLDIENLKNSERNYEEVKFVIDNLHLVPQVFRFSGQYLPQPDKKKRKRSADAIDIHTIDPSSTDLNLSLMQTKHVHYGMFHGLDCREFKRFELPSNEKELFQSQNLSKIMEIAEEVHECISGLDYHLLCAREPLTQMAFKYLVLMILRKLHEHGLTKKEQKVISITGMESVSFKKKIRDEYWDRYWKKDKTKNITGSKEKTVVVKSDMAIWDDDDFKPEDATQVKQKDIFLRTPLNIEMKRANLLRSMNNGIELTQLALQSLARMEGRADAKDKAFKTDKEKYKVEKEVFSILTDGTTLYVLRHDVEKDKYWMSKGITDPMNVAKALCWLFLISGGSNSETAQFNENWEVTETRDTMDEPKEAMKKDKDEDMDEYANSILREDMQKEFNMLTYRHLDYLSRMQCPSLFENEVRQHATESSSSGLFFPGDTTGDSTLGEVGIFFASQQHSHN